MKQPDLAGLTDKQAEYIKWLEDGRAGASDLIIELNLTSKVFAQDLMLIRSGFPNESTYIGKADKSKKFEHAMILFDKIEKVKALAGYFKEVEVEQESTKNKLNLKPGDNPYEQMVKRVKKNGNPNN